MEEEWGGHNRVAKTPEADRISPAGTAATLHGVTLFWFLETETLLHGHKLFLSPTSVHPNRLTQTEVIRVFLPSGQRVWPALLAKWLCPEGKGERMSLSSTELHDKLRV